MISYASRVTKVYHIEGQDDITYTHGAGSSTVLETPAPTQVSASPDGSQICRSVGGACERAFQEFEDDRVYTSRAAYKARVHGKMLMVTSLWQAQCLASFECQDYGIGTSGREIKDA